MLPFPHRTVQILTRTQPILVTAARQGVSLCQGMSVMGNAYSASGNRKQCSRSSSVHIGGDTGWDTEGNSERALLLEENARLRALVVKLSDLVLRNVVDQNSRPQLLPARRPAAE